MKCRSVLEVLCASIEAVIPARKHGKHRNIFSPSFSVIRKGSCGNFALSTACYSALHMSLSEGGGGGGTALSSPALDPPQM